MKRLCFVLFLGLGCGGFARADDLADANRLLAAKAYTQAFPIYRRLAEAGNPEAQLRLGEMYWFGDATPADLAQARSWLERSAKAGNADAAASLASLKRRETHGDEIVYWTTSYTGEDMVSGKYDCKRPALPAVSRTRAEIEAVSAQINAWHVCYNGFVANLNDALPPGKRIPAETLDMMTPAEGAMAQRHLDRVYAGLIDKARQDASRFNADETAWHKATESYVMSVAQDNQNGKADMDRAMRELDQWQGQKSWESARAVSAPTPTRK